MEYELKNHGLTFPTVEEIQKSLDAGYVLGGSGLAEMQEIQPSRNWELFLPAPEIQHNQWFDTFNCTGYGSNNLVEIVLKRMYGGSWDFSDRATGIDAGTFPPGNNPHRVLDSIRDNGLSEEKYLPFDEIIKSANDYYSPRPVPPNVRRSANLFKQKFSLRHDWVSIGNMTDKSYRIWESLKYCPVGVSVLAWKKRGDKFFKLPGEVDSHWTVIFGGKAGEYFRCFDTYDQTEKILEWGYDFNMAKRISIQENQSSCWQKFINYIT